MKLDSLDFSDLIIMSNGDVFLKGTPEFGAQMRKIPDEYREEVGQLGEVVEKAFASKKHNEMENIRLSFGKLSFRVANYSGVDGSAYFLRRLATRVPTFEELGFYPGLASWLLAPERQKGLVLFCGSQGSGKTTSAASFIAARLQRYGGHAISWENPVEMPLAGAHGDYGYAFQTQVRDESELAAHIERSYRFSNPNIIYVGEIRSQHAASEVSRAALGSANQIVVSTIHGMDIKNALERLLTLACEHDGNIDRKSVV